MCERSIYCLKNLKYLCLRLASARVLLAGGFSMLLLGMVVALFIATFHSTL